MNDSARNIVAIELEIYGQHFTVRAPANERERVENAARYVNQVIEELFAAGTTRDTGRLAIQAALMIAIELYKLKDDIHAEAGLTEEVKNRINRMIEHLDHTLRNL